jgi:mono/diheme cytochrome c family protein
MKRVVLSTAVLLMSCFGAWAQDKAAKDIFLDKCSVCHGPDGAGKTAMGKRLKVADVKDTVEKHTAAEMMTTVQNGKGTSMAAFGKDFNKDQIKALVEYYRGLAKK